LEFTKSVSIRVEGSHFARILTEVLLNIASRDSEAMVHTIHTPGAAFFDHVPENNNNNDHLARFSSA
jgi:hypothetical protein